ncbi:MAG: folylpolyglutamate synthase/dihydrofolate synthase, partial [Erysipelotrichaceae bacterium]|nr:folylpolyglutamate synthase/dihydrofolate synthase [Erysipelotrichaceae bacterium]
PISDEDLVAYANRYSEDWDKYGITMFEIDMFLSVMYFLEHKADIVLYEVGLGGELDATNIIDPLVSVITTIGYDHMDYLGNTIEEIAGAKAGIIKPNRPLITHERKSSCLQVFENTCKRTNSPMILVQDALDVQTKGTVSFRYGEFGLMHLQSSALYQVDNACNALECVGILRKAGYRISNAQAVSGIEHSMWKGRFEHVDWPGCDVWMDGAHNEHGMQALTKTLKNLNRPMTIVFTALRDKETDKMLEMLLQVSDDVIVTEFAFYRAKKAQDLAKDYPVKVMENWEEAIETALNNNPGTVIITGSLYFISDVRLWFKQKGVLR